MEEVGLSPPRAREQGLLCRELPDGLMVYDEERHQAHSLNQAATVVWRHCNGRRGVSDLAVLLRQDLDLPAAEEVVWLALDRLEKAHLLQEKLARPADPAQYSRRAVIRKLGKAGAVVALVPLVTSITAPNAAAQASPSNPAGCDGKQVGDACTFANSTQTGVCVQNGPILVCQPN